MTSAEKGMEMTYRENGGVFLPCNAYWFAKTYSGLTAEQIDVLMAQVADRVKAEATRLPPAEKPLKIAEGPDGK